MPAPPQESEPAMVERNRRRHRGPLVYNCRVLRAMACPSSPAHWRQAGLPLPGAVLAYWPARLCFRRRQRWFPSSSRSNASSASPTPSPMRSRKPRSPPRSIPPPATTICWSKFYVDNDTDIGHFVNEKVQVRSRHPGHPHHHHLQGVRHGFGSHRASARCDCKGILDARRTQRRDQD